MSADPASGDVSSGNPAFWKGVAVWTLVFGALSGALQTWQAALGLAKFGGYEYLPRVAALSIARELAVGSAFTAGLFAWISGTHRRAPAWVRSTFRPTARQLVVAFPMACGVAALVGMAVSLLVVRACYGGPFAESWSSATRILDLSDLSFAVTSMLLHCALLLGISWFAMPRLAAISWSLPRKLLAASVAVTLLSFALGVLAAVSLPGSL